MKRKHIIWSLLLLPLVFACTKTSENSNSFNDDSTLSEPSDQSTSEEEINLVGTYNKIEHDVDGFEMSGQFIYSTLIINEDKTGAIIDVDAYGEKRQNGTYAETATGLVLTIGLKKYDFIYDKSAKTLTYTGRINRRDVKMSYIREDVLPLTTVGERAFTDEFFGESLAENFYNYAPSIMMEGNDVMHVWYCSNKDSGNVTDYIAYRRGELQGDGKWTFAEKALVLEPTKDTWDSRHTCDPTVIKGDFTYNKEHYAYLMAYLGCLTSDSSRNEVGIAVSKDPAGPWVKMNHLNPIANYYTSPEYVDDVWTWGYGQPSLVSVDKGGQILLFYSKGIATGTFQAVEHWDLHDLNNPVKIAAANVSNAGIVNANGGADVINNADFAYDAFYNRLYVIKEDFPYTALERPDWITSTNTVQYIDLPKEDVMGETLFKPQTLRWQKVGALGTAETGMARVHNSGLLSDEYGWIINPYQIPVVYTKCDLYDDYPDWDGKGQWPALHTYRLHGYLLEL